MSGNICRFILSCTKIPFWTVWLFKEVFLKIFIALHWQHPSTFLSRFVILFFYSTLVSPKVLLKFVKCVIFHVQVPSSQVTNSYLSFLQSLFSFLVEKHSFRFLPRLSFRNAVRNAQLKIYFCQLCYWIIVPVRDGVSFQFFCKTCRYCLDLWTIVRNIQLKTLPNQWYFFRLFS